MVILGCELGSVSSCAPLLLQVRACNSVTVCSSLCQTALNVCGPSGCMQTASRMPHWSTWVLGNPCALLGVAKSAFCQA